MKNSQGERGVFSPFTHTPNYTKWIFCIVWGGLLGKMAVGAFYVFCLCTGVLLFWWRLPLLFDLIVACYRLTVPKMVSRFCLSVFYIVYSKTFRNYFLFSKFLRFPVRWKFFKRWSLCEENFYPMTLFENLVVMAPMAPLSCVLCAVFLFPANSFFVQLLL